MTSAAASNRIWAVLNAEVRVSTAISGFRYYSRSGGSSTPLMRRNPEGVSRGHCTIDLVLEDAKASQGGVRWEDQRSQMSSWLRSGNVDARANRCLRLPGI